MQELVAQGEQLDNVERKVADINADMRVTQRHIDSIKSVWGGFKNWWSGKKETDKPTRSHHLQHADQEPSQLRQTVEQQRESAPPSRAGNASGFFDEDDSSFGAPRQQQPPSGTGQRQQAFSARAQYEMQLQDDLGNGVMLF